jgi:hypothetical protein
MSVDFDVSVAIRPLDANTVLAGERTSCKSAVPAV